MNGSNYVKGLGIALFRVYFFSEADTSRKKSSYNYWNFQNELSWDNFLKVYSSGFLSI